VRKRSRQMERRKDIDCHVRRETCRANAKPRLLCNAPDMAIYVPTSCALANHFPMRLFPPSIYLNPSKKYIFPCLIYVIPSVKYINRRAKYIFHRKNYINQAGKYVFPWLKHLPLHRISRGNNTNSPERDVVPMKAARWRLTGNRLTARQCANR